jgi:hypothetical protein
VPPSPSNVSSRCGRARSHCRFAESTAQSLYVRFTNIFSGSFSEHAMRLNPRRTLTSSATARGRWAAPTRPPPAAARSASNPSTCPSPRAAPARAPTPRAPLAIGGKVIKCPSLLNVLKDTYDRSCY